MDPAPDAPERPAARDPFAAALANASLLGAGYLLLGRWRLALGNAAVTLLLVVLLATGARPFWLPAAAPVWWLAVTWHGWRLARRSGGERPRGVAWQRIRALVVTGAVLLAVVALRVDAAGIERDAAEAHRRGDCAETLAILGELWGGHRVVDGRLVERTEDDVEACELLVAAEGQAPNDRLAAERTLADYQAHPGARWEGVADRRAELVLAEAAERFDTALRGGTGALTAGFDLLATVLGEFPGQEDAVEAVLDGFLDGLPTRDACETTAIARWLDRRQDTGDVLDRAAEIVPEIEPAAIVGCGDQAVGAEDWERARDRYEQLLDRYPEHELTADAEAGVERAATEIELARLRELLVTGYETDLPAYCDDPAPYRGAERYRGGGPHPALLFGDTEHASELPAPWTTEDPTEAVLVVCVDGREYGSTVETCAYEYEDSPSGYENVTFHTQRYPVRVYEVRTGRRVDRSAVEIGGNCPAILTYEYYGTDPGPPSDDYVFSTESDVRAAYQPLIDP